MYNEMAKRDEHFGLSVDSLNAAARVLRLGVRPSSGAARFEMASAPELVKTLLPISAAVPADAAPYKDSQSQRDCALQPRVARNELPWERGLKKSPTPTGLRLIDVKQQDKVATTPLGLKVLRYLYPGLLAARNPGLRCATPLGLQQAIRARLASLLLAMLFFSGCAGYTLGPTNGVVAGDKSVQITPFANKTLEPRLGAAVTTQMRKELQRDGTFKLASHDDGDIIVSGVITHYTRHELTLVPHDLVTVRDYRVTLTAHVTARERATGKILLDQPVSGFTLLRVGTDLTSSERQALPLLAADLAKHATALLVEGGW